MNQSFPVGALLVMSDQQTLKQRISRAYQVELTRSEEVRQSPLSRHFCADSQVSTLLAKIFGKICQPTLIKIRHTIVTFPLVSLLSGDRRRSFFGKPTNGIFSP